MLLLWFLIVSEAKNLQENSQTNQYKKISDRQSNYPTNKISHRRIPSSIQLNLIFCMWSWSIKYHLMCWCSGLLCSWTLSAIESHKAKAAVQNKNKRKLDRPFNFRVFTRFAYYFIQFILFLLLLFGRIVRMHFIASTEQEQASDTFYTNENFVYVRVCEQHWLSQIHFITCIINNWLINGSSITIIFSFERDGRICGKENIKKQIFHNFTTLNVQIFRQRFWRKNVWK